MKAVILTTKEYYSFAESDYWESVDCSLIKTFILSLYKECPLNEDDAIESFFSKASAKSEKADDYWCIHSGKDFNILKRQLHDCIIYVLPCIPEYHLVSEGRLCYEMRPRQDYIGTFTKVVLNDLNNNITSGDIMLILHDLDIFAKNKYKDGDERHVRHCEIVGGSILDEMISKKIVKRDNIYGFQHDYDPDEWRVYPLIAEKGKLLEQEPIDNFIEKLNRKIEVNRELNSD